MHTPAESALHHRPATAAHPAMRGLGLRAGALNGFVSGRQLDERWRRAFANSRRNGSGAALLVVETGDDDALVQHAAEGLRRCVRDTDLVAHRHGGHFGVLIDGFATPAEALRVAETIAHRIRQRVRPPAFNLAAELSIGIAAPEPDDDVPADVMVRAKARAHLVEAD